MLHCAVWKCARVCLLAYAPIDLAVALTEEPEWALQLSFALLVGIGTSYFQTRLLVEALAMTCVTVAAIFVIVASTSFDFTQAGLLSGRHR